MIVKDKFELVYKTSGDVYNVAPLASSTLKAYELEKDEYDHLRMMVNSFSKAKRHPASNIVSKELNSLILVKMDSYPLPGFVTNRGQGVVNLSVFPVKMITDYMPSDMFSLFLYTIALKNFINKKPFKAGTEANISGMIFSIFMKLFGKKSGLIGSYGYLIPKLQYLIYLYVSVAMMGLPQNESTKKKIAAITYTDKDDLDLNYDFKSTSEFLKSINNNNIIPMSENKFSTTIINMGGIASLPMFEDTSRFFATLMACGIPNSQFPPTWVKINPNLYGKLVDISTRMLSRII